MGHSLSGRIDRQWLSNRKVLISPYSIGQRPWGGKSLPAALTKEQVKNSPDIDTDKPISRQYEMQYLKYYRIPTIGGVPVCGVWAEPEHDAMSSGIGGLLSQFRQAEIDREETARRDHYDSHLRSCNAVIKYHIRATDGDIGHVTPCSSTMKPGQFATSSWRRATGGSGTRYSSRRNGSTM